MRPITLEFFGEFALNDTLDTRLLTLPRFSSKMTPPLGEPHNVPPPPPFFQFSDINRGRLTPHHQSVTKTQPPHMPPSYKLLALPRSNGRRQY